MTKEPFNYNEFYKTQGVNFIDYPARFALVASLCRGRVFDIGCCFGALSDYYFGDYTGFDFAPYVIEKAKEVRRKDAKFELFDCSDLASLDIENCDTFVFAEFLEHFENDEKILGPIFARAKPGTRIVITVPNGDRIPDPSHLRTLTIPELRKKFSPYGKVKFYNWENSTLHIICTIDLGQKNDDLVSLVMIVKDEEKGLERAVFSCLEFVDNIVISCDSKSSDKTEQIAKLYADVLKTHVFENDFSKARNNAHQGVKTKWILFLDGHEYVAKRENLEKFLALDVDGLLIPIEMENKFIFNNPRFYKTGIQFEGKVHERQSCKVTYFYPGFLIVHDRLTTQTNEAVLARLQQRDEMVPRIMGEEIKKNPKNTRALLHLAMYWQGKKQFKKALSIYSQYLKFSKNPQERWFVLFNRCLCFLVLNKKFRAFWTASRADLEMPGRWEIQKIYGMMFFEKKQYEKALEYLNLSFQENSFNTLYRPLPRENSSTWNLIGECFFNLSNFDKANIAFDRAAELTKDEKQKEFFEKRAALMRDILKESFKS
jgi:glycosyltransferase involved in cell wall biosynthesis